MASFGLPDTAVDWFELIGLTSAGVAAIWAGVKWLPPAVEAWGKRREEKRQLTAGLVQVVAQFPGFITRIEDAFEVIAESGKRLFNIEQDQRQQTVMMHSIIETLPEEVVWTDSNGEPTAVTQGFTAMTGMDLSAMRDGGWKRMVSTDDLDRVEKAWEAARLKGQVFRCAYSIHNVQYPDRGEFEIECLAMPMTNKAGWKAVFARTADRMDNAPVSMSTNTPIV